MNLYLTYTYKNHSAPYSYPHFSKFLISYGKTLGLVFLIAYYISSFVILIVYNTSGLFVTYSIPILLKGFNAASLAITSISAPV